MNGTNYEDRAKEDFRNGTKSETLYAQEVTYRLGWQTARRSASAPAQSETKAESSPFKVALPPTISLITPVVEAPAPKKAKAKKPSSQLDLF